MHEPNYVEMQTREWIRTWESVHGRNKLRYAMCI